MIVTRKAFDPAAAVVAASAGSIDAALHLPAVAHECGIAFDPGDVAEVFKPTRYIADLKPAGRFVAKDLVKVGDVSLLMKTLLDKGLMRGDCMTVAGCSMAEDVKRVAWNGDVFWNCGGQDVVRPADRPPLAAGGGGLRGKLDGRSSGAPWGFYVGRGFCVGHVGPEAAAGGPRGPVCAGDVIAIDADGGSLQAPLSKSEFEKRRAARQPRATAFWLGYLGSAPSRSGRRATASSRILAGRPRRRAMRISEYILSVALLGFGLGLTAAYALDGTPSPANVAPALGVGVAPEGAPSVGISPGRATAAFQAFQKGARALQAGDTKSGLEALEYAARNGEVMALWKLGRMYADGDGVKQSDQRAFEYFRTLADSHAEETPGTTPAVFVAKAFVEIGSYYLTGIPNYLKPDAGHAHQMFSYAASYFGDPDAQYRLGRTYLDGQGTAKSPKQAARWLTSAAGKGQYQAQAVLGAMLFKGESVPRDAARGLMYLILARDAATPKETWIADLYNAALKQATADEQAVALVHVEHWIDQSRSGHHP